MIGYCSPRMVHLTKSCGSYVSQMKKQANKNKSTLSQDLIIAAPPSMTQLRPSSEKDQNTGCLMTMWHSTKPYYWSTPAINWVILFLMIQVLIHDGQKMKDKTKNIVNLTETI